MIVVQHHKQLIANNYRTLVHMITLTMQAMHFLKNLFILFFFFLLSSFKSGFFLYLFNCLFLFLLPCTELGGSNRWQNWKMGMLQAFHKHDVLKPICWIAHSLSLPASYVHEQTGQVLLNFCQLFIFLLYLFSYYCFQMRNQARKWASKVFRFLKVNPPSRPQVSYFYSDEHENIKKKSFLS